MVATNVLRAFAVRRKGSTPFWGTIHSDVETAQPFGLYVRSNLMKKIVNV